MQPAQNLGVVIGDLIEISARRKTVGKVMPAFCDLRGQARLQVDGLTRENAGAGLDQVVEVRKIQTRAAEHVVLTPIGITLQERDLKYIGILLDGLSIVSGDRIQAKLFGARSADFKVVRTTPTGPVLIAPSTTLEISRACPPSISPRPLFLTKR